MRPGIWLSTVFAVELIAPGCSATTAPSDVPYKPYAERAETQTQNGLSVTGGILTGEEARTVYGVVIVVLSVGGFGVGATLVMER
jgi:hypothetical protein